MYDATPLKTQLADKYRVREYAAAKIGEKHLIPLLGVWNSFRDIDFFALPDAFVLKCTHGAGYNIRIQDKNTLNLVALERQITLWLQENYAFRSGFELQYADIPPKIIAEQYMKDAVHGDLLDYKFFCFHGEPAYCQVIGGRFSCETMDFFDMNWTLQDFTRLAGNTPVPHAAHVPSRPSTLPQMIAACRKACSSHPLCARRSL